MPVSSNVSHQPATIANSSASSKSCLRSFMHASSSKSTARSGHSLRSRSWMKWHPRKEGQPSAAHTSARPLKDKQTSKARSAVEQTEARSGAHSPRMHSRQFQSSSSTRFGWSLTVKLVGASPIGASCIQSIGAVQWLQHVLLARRALLANQSLNRTFCGVGQLGFISFSPNCPAPQTAG